VAAVRAANEVLKLYAKCYTVFGSSGVELRLILQPDAMSVTPDLVPAFFCGEIMSNIKAILEALQAGPATSTELADRLQMDRASAKVACLALIKKQLVKREMTDRVGKGPKTQYRYELKSTS
jgi:predicted transcriptional regulator